MRADGFELFVLDQLPGSFVNLARCVVIVVVAEIGTDHDQGFFSAPDRLQYLCHLFRRTIAYHQRNQGEVIQYRLQKGQVHFQAVFLLMGGLHDLNPGKRFQFFLGFIINVDKAQGGGETGRPGQGHPF